MLIILEKLRRIEEKLLSLKDFQKISDYRLILKLNMSANLYIVTDAISNAEISEMVKDEKIDIDIETLSLAEFESDDYYKSLFDRTEPLDLGLRRSLSNIIDDDGDMEKNFSCPIISFYSYKGGVGRTTALALFASYYATHYAKKVFIIDCDFEAPGLINFFGLSSEENPRNGIVEYLKDKEGLGDQINLRDGYTYEISKNYAGDGEIHLLPAGNIFDDHNRFDYLEALARLDIHGTSTIVDQFQNTITDINKLFNPDVILIDSRTGFNDVFGIIANRLSNTVVGFFGNNIQNRPGLHFFINTLLRKKREVDLILVLSIISSSFTKALKAFNDEIESYIQNSIEDDLESLPVLPVFSLARYPSLEKIGTSDEDPDDFISIVNRKMLNDYNELFEKLVKTVSRSTDRIAGEATMEKTPSEKREVDEGQATKAPGKDQSDKSDDITKLKQEILKQLSDNFPEPYAENIEFTEDFLHKEFYIRKCMEDIFNQDKFILLGSKGTGKTAFYQALRQNDFFSKLRGKAQKNHTNYKVINIITLEGEKAGDKNKFFDVSANISQSDIKDPDFFYNRFWRVYIWSAIRIDDSKTGFVSSVQAPSMKSDAVTAKFFKECIYQEEKFEAIENELYAIDKHLKSNDQYLIITFDQLDKVVKPSLWSTAISPLIKFCQIWNYDRISPKLFLRRDLFNKLGNLTNKASLEKQAINLEWTQEELYAFFFKVIFSQCQDTFFKYAKITEKISEDDLGQIVKSIKKKNSYNQLPPDIYLLKPLVKVFFGEYAGKSGETYDWIYTNLKNADGTISLRPFLDMIKFAVEIQYKQPFLNKDQFPLLSSKCLMHASVREKSVEGHFIDLAKEEGNEYLKVIIEDIRDNKVPDNLKMSPLMEDDFESLMTDIINRHQDLLKDVPLRELEDALKLNGIIFVKYVRGGKKQYTFVYLYKYYLGLRSPRKQ